MACFRERRSFPDLSEGITLTKISSPSLTISLTLPTRELASSVICTKPSVPGKISTNAALEVVQRSTASMGKFDKMREGEPERKKVLSKTKKRKFESNTSKSFASSEGQKSMKILNAVMNGGGVEKEKAIRKGKYAKGETAYDYDYDDGLGASSFKKKKVSVGNDGNILYANQILTRANISILLLSGKGRCW